MSKRFDIAIVGAGTAGLQVALRLADADCAVTIYDAGPHPQFDDSNDVALRVSAITPGTRSSLESLGAWRHIEKHRHCAFERMKVWDEADDPGGHAGLEFAADEFAIPALGYIVENVLLQHALLQELRRSPTECRFETALSNASFQNGKVTLSFEGGYTATPDLLIAADGARSAIREFAGIRTKSHDYAQSAFVTHLLPSRSHEATAWQRFLRDGPLGILPLQDGRVSVVWSTTTEKAQAAMAMSDEALGACLSDVADGVLGAFKVAGPRGTFPLRAQHANHYVQQGLALIGDAAHSVHPLAGQGANLGFADADVLAGVIIEALARGEVPSDRPVLRRYERARRGENGTMMQALTGLNHLYTSDSDVVATLRRAGTALFANSGPVRRKVVGVALGNTQRQTGSS